jgi:diacylglycerol O-acyltransferase
MPALSVIDLAMFVLETSERPFNIGPLIVLDPPPRFRGNFADKLAARMLKRPIGAPFNYRVRLLPPGGPRLEVDQEADPTAHFHRLTLAAPGTLEQLCTKVCELHQARLDRDRPLWELYVIDGLAGGKVALYGKVHHGIIDGRGFVKVISAWLSTAKSDRTVRAMWEGVPRSATESRPRAALAAQVSSLLRSATGAAGSAVAMSRMLAAQGLKTLGVGGAAGMSLPFVGIPRALSGRLSAKRSFAFCTLPIAELKAVGAARDAKLNDVLLATLDIAIDHYLHERGARAAKALVAAMPIALADAAGGNAIAVLQFALGAPGRTAVERLADICAETAKVKQVVAKESSETVMLYTTLVHGLPALLEKLRLKPGLSVSNLIVSNPFGFAEPRFLMGASVELVLPVSVVAAGQMLNVTAVTLGNQLQVGFLGIPSAVPGIDQLSDHMLRAFSELKLAALKPAAAQAPAKRIRAPRPAARRRAA